MAMNRDGFLRMALLAMVLALGIAGQAMAATYYVDGGNTAAKDDNDGAEKSPWKTVQHAADTVRAGDVVVVRPGEYNELVTVKQSGAKDKLIILRGEPSRKARVKGFVLEGDYIAIEGFEVASDADKANGIFAGQTHQKNARKGCQIADNFIHDVDGTAIVSGEQALVKGNLMRQVGWGLFVNSGTLVEDNEIDGLIVKMIEKNGKKQLRSAKYSFFAGDDITFRGNYFHGTPMKDVVTMGTCFFGTWDAWIYGASHRILIENNRCFNATHASEPEAKQHKKSSHITYRNNLFVNTVHVGVLPKDWSHVTIENNTFINCGAYPVWFQSERQTEGSVVRNNLIAYIDREAQVEKYGWSPAESGVRIDSQGAKDFCDYNMFWGCKNRGYGEHDFVAEPQFVDPDKGDYRLKPGSPGIDMGVDAGLKTDLEGTPRPQGKAPDIGAFEHKATQTKPAPSEVEGK